MPVRSSLSQRRNAPPDRPRRKERAPRYVRPGTYRGPHDRPFQEEHPMRKITKRSAAVLTAAVIAVGGAGAAWAAWSLTGAGTANAKSATVLPLKANSVDVEG